MAETMDAASIESRVIRIEWALKRLAAIPRGASRVTNRGRQAEVTHGERSEP
jgi:hypothetical protein